MNKSFLIFFIPVICISVLVFFSSRLYSFRNMTLAQLKSEFHISFVFGKIAYSLYSILIIAYLIISFTKGLFLKPIVIIILSYIFGNSSANNKNLPLSTQIPYPIMIINCILMFAFFCIFLFFLLWYF